jgi:DNA-binding beta-propeller fold protein YncE
MGIEGSKSTTEGALVRVDLGTFTVAVTEGLKYVPAGLAVTPDGTELLVTGSLNGTQIFDGKTLAPIGSIPGGQEQAIVIAPQ